MNFFKKPVSITNAAGVVERTIVPAPALGGAIVRKGSAIESTITSDGIGGFNVYDKDGRLVNRLRRQP